MITKIRDNLFLGGIKDLVERDLKELGITCILNVASEINDKIKGFILEKEGFGDNWQDAKRFAPAAADLLIDLLQEGKVVFVHCAVGKSRSPHVIALALAKMLDKNYYEVFNEIRELRPQVLAVSLQEDIDNNVRNRF